MRISLKGGALFSFAGLWEVWTAPDGTKVRSYTIVTCAPNALMGQLHHRMPVILTPEAEAVWLDPHVTDPDVLLPLLVPYPSDLMEAVRVGPLVSNVANDSPNVLLPLPGFAPLTATDGAPSA